MQPPLKAILKEIRSLDPFPDVAARVLEIAGRDEVQPADLIEVVQIDAALTGKVLKLCNSAFYGFQREVASLEEAGNMLGVRTLVNLVLTSSANRYFRNYGGASPELQARLWKKSVTHAIAARLIAERCGHVDKERAYTAGLLQNIGSLVLERFYKESEQYLEAVTAQGFALIEAEKYTLGLHHAELGARLMTSWELPEVLTDSVRFHHAPEQARIDPVLTATVHLAETIAAARIDDDDEGRLAYEVSAAALELTGLEAADFEGIEIDLLLELDKASDLLKI